MTEDRHLTCSLALFTAGLVCAGLACLVGQAQADEQPSLNVGLVYPASSEDGLGQGVPYLFLSSTSFQLACKDDQHLTVPEAWREYFALTEEFPEAEFSQYEGCGQQQSPTSTADWPYPENAYPVFTWHDATLDDQSTEVRDSVSAVPQVGYYSVIASNPLPEISVQAALEMAKNSGSIGAVWGSTTQLIDGVAIEPFLALREIEKDTEVGKNYYWNVSAGGVDFELGPPQQVVSFKAMGFKADLVRSFPAPYEWDYCPTEGGECVHFDDFELATYYMSKYGGVGAKYDNKNYWVKLPNFEVVGSEVGEYSAAVMSYARGDLKRVVDISGRYISEQKASAAKIDMYLFRAAALARLGNYNEARVEVQEALEVNPLAKRTLRYGIMVELAEAGVKTELSESYFKVLEDNYSKHEAFEKSYGQLK